MQKLRLSEILKAKRTALGSFDALAKAITEAGGGIGVDRRKLQRLVALAGQDLKAGDIAKSENDVNLRISELVALNAFLSPTGDGLAAHPIFDQPSILAALTERSELVFLHAAQPNDKRQSTEVSVWDVRCQAEIMNSVNAYRANIGITMQEVMNREPKNRPDGEIGGWEKWFADDRDASIVSIGSPRACRASERMLAKMFKVEAFEKTVRAEQSLPFHFIWARRTDKFGSRFAGDAYSIKRLDSQLASAIRRNPLTSMGLRVGDTVHPARMGGETWKDYGIIAAQRRRSGQLWLALCGLTGPTTYAAAKAVRSLINVIPQNPVGKNSAVQWAVVEADIEKTDMPGDARRVIRQEIIDGPKVWTGGDG